jgi:hypothetical protein
MADTPNTITISITVPAEVGAQLAPLVNRALAVLQKWEALADAGKAAIQPIQSDVKQAADAMTSAQSSLDAALGDIRNNAAEITSIVRTFKIHEHV